jgi:serine/threonine protein kinase
MTATGQPSPYPEAGEIIDGKYEIERYIGEGGMGAVARAMHLLRKAPVALKFMSPAVLYIEGAVDRFINEAVAASALKSDHVVQVFDVGKLPSGAPYLVLELLDGQSRSRGPPTSSCRCSVPSRSRTAPESSTAISSLRTASS